MPKVDSKHLDLKDLVNSPGWPDLLAVVQEWQDRDREDLLSLAGLPLGLEARGRWIRAQEFLDLAGVLAAEPKPEPEPEEVKDDGF